jgi:hypothetical protein
MRALGALGSHAKRDGQACAVLHGMSAKLELRVGTRRTPQTDRVKHVAFIGGAVRLMDATHPVAASMPRDAAKA